MAHRIHRHPEPDRGSPGRYDCRLQDAGEVHSNGAGNVGGYIEMSAAADWLNELQSLAVRLGACNIGPDLAGLTLAHAWGMFLILHRMAARGAHVG